MILRNLYFSILFVISLFGLQHCNSNPIPNETLLKKTIMEGIDLPLQATDSVFFTSELQHCGVGAESSERHWLDFELETSPYVDILQHKTLQSVLIYGEKCDSLINAAETFNGETAVNYLTDKKLFVSVYGELLASQDVVVYESYHKGDSIIYITKNLVYKNEVWMKTNEEMTFYYKNSKITIDQLQK